MLKPSPIQRLRTLSASSKNKILIQLIKYNSLYNLIVALVAAGVMPLTLTRLSGIKVNTLVESYFAKQ